MKSKPVIGLTLLLALSLIGLTWNFLTLQAAAVSTTSVYRVVLSPLAAGIATDDTHPAQIVTNQQEVTATSSATLYLPVVFRSFCANVFSYNETIRYNLSKISATQAWQSCYQGQGITVAVIDSGVDLDHPDLQANIVSSKNFVSGVSSADDDYGHGTHVAGIIAGVNNNGGVIGVAPKASLMPVKVLNYQGSGTIYNVAAGIEWAADNGAKIINLSLGSVSGSSTLKAAVDYAYNKGVLVIAAGGNCGDSSYDDNGCSYQDQPVYPGAYGNVMAVASTDSSDNQSSFSNQGSYIDIAAPGSTIYSTYLSSSYTFMSGTSMATPHVAGLAALLWSENSGWTNQQVWTQIASTAQDLGTSGWDSQFGYGRINAATAMGVSQIASTAAADNTVTESVAAEVDPQAPYVPGEILLKLQSGFTVNKVIGQGQLRAAEVKVAGTIDQLGVQKLTIATGQEQAMLTQLLASMGVVYAELNYIVTAH